MNKWFKERGISQEQIALALDVSVSTVSRLVNYKSNLNMKRAAILHDEFGVPFDIMYPIHISEEVLV